VAERAGNCPDGEAADHPGGQAGCASQRSELGKAREFGQGGAATLVKRHG
jgi:hypothetical protein